MAATGRSNLLVWFWLFIPLGALQVYYAIRQLSRAPRLPRR
jgi:hypothetical protein